MNTVNHENKPVRMAFSVTHQRVQHYDDVVGFMVNSEVERFKTEHGRQPTQQQIAFLKKEIIRHAVIRHDLETAQKIKISKSNILNEHPLRTRV